MPRTRERRVKRTRPRLPPLLERLILGAEHRGETERAFALSALGRLAVVAIPREGVFGPADDEGLYVAIENVARKHCGYRELRQAVKVALEPITDFDHREAIENAYNQSDAASDRVYFYAGLAFGVTLARFGDSSW
jgi:hypothetical protein